MNGRPDNTPLGILLVLLAMSIVPAMDGIAKHLGETYSVFEITWARFFFHFLILCPIVFWRYGRRAFHVPRFGLQVFRGGLLLLATICFFASLQWLPMADTLSLFFISPLIVTGLSPWLLGEQVGVRRWSAVVVGFIGALIIVRPGIGVFEWASLFGLGSGACYAAYIIITRKLSGTAPPLVTLAFTAMLGAVALSVMVPVVWIPPADLATWGLMVALGVIAATGHFLLIVAYERAPAPVLAPYHYSEIIMTTIIGYAVFSDFPDRWTLLGIAVVVGSGIYISLREKPKKPVIETL